MVYVVLFSFFSRLFMRSLVISFNGKTPSEQEQEQLSCCSLVSPSFLSVERNRKLVGGFLFF